MKKILMRGTSVPESIGVHAMTICTMRIVSKFIPDAEFTIFSIKPEFEYRLYNEYNFNLKVVQYSGNRSKSVFRLFRAMLWGALYKLFKIDMGQLINDEMLRTISEADIVVDMFGDGFSDNTGGKGGSMASISHVFQILLATSLQKQVVLYPQSIGPFRNKIVRYLAKLFINKVESVTAREEITKNYLQEIGVNKTPIYLTADTAFVLEPASRKRVEKILAKNNVAKDNEAMIGINISQLANYRSKNLVKVKRDYMELMVKLADYLATTLDVSVIFLPHAIYPKEIVNNDRKEMEDDIAAVKEAYEKVENKDKIVPLIDEYSASELKGIIGGCDMFIGARMHANIAAISSCVPTIAIAYSHKAPGIMQMVGLERYVCDFKTMTFEELKSKVDDMWQDKEKIKEEMMPNVEELKESVWFNGKLVKDLLDKRK